MNSESPLSAEARRLIVQARGADDPTDDDRTRVKTRWLASVAAAAGVSALGEAARAASGTGWGLKAAAGAILAVAGAVGLYALLPGDAAPERTAPQLGGSGVRGAAPVAKATPGPVEAPEISESPATESPATESPATESPTTESAAAASLAEETAPAADPPRALEAAQPRAIERPSAPPRRAATVRRAPEPAPAAPPLPAATRESGELIATGGAGATRIIGAPNSDLEEAAGEATAEQPPAVAVRQLGEEAALLSQVRENLKARAPRRALELLRQFEQRFASPLLSMEAAALRVDALCQSGEVLRGQQEAERFQTTWPSSPLGRRVRAACL